MDAIVEAALKKWPNVPHCYGWLALDARGDWYMRDDRIQAAGPFPQVKGSRITHEKLRQFIERNYAVDEAGCWFFQNGPQRVYVQLEAAPHIWRLNADPRGAAWAPLVFSHNGGAARVESVWLDEADRLFLACEWQGQLVLGLVHSMDMGLAAEAVEAGLWSPQTSTWAALQVRYGFQLQPKAATAVQQA
ncbi:DUF2946 family protein [Paucibacter sp. Y2R2-4]|uniref:DUF2946 family protein n=1 Tax=Paucibacter sp. Y2R2-4 TaxID=2893553 RepID=UPI0021E422D5|nr:DUF2946 family protein [Paucibacter sp. Y2R2-4]MCV2350685.1 DUF2946 family protein [Paucibacter sp. Y2R2-4]